MKTKEDLFREYLYLMQTEEEKKFEHVLHLFNEIIGLGYIDALQNLTKWWTEQNVEKWNFINENQ